MHKVMLICLGCALGFYSQAREYEFFDAHTHYNENVWDAISPQQAIDKLRQAGIRHAVVSSTHDDGTQKLYDTDPDFVVRSLRPYKSSEHRIHWVRDKTLIDYLRQRLAKYDYVAIGEFHLHGEQADLPVVRDVVQLAREHKLILHIHSDAEAIHRVFKQYPQARIVWAHAGFENAGTVQDMMDTYPKLWADLSFRSEIFGNKRFLGTWEALLNKHADRFMVGVDTYIPERWLRVDDVNAHFTAMLDALPENVARQIAFHNAKKLYH